MLVANAHVILSQNLVHIGEVSRGLKLQEDGWSLSARRHFAFQTDFFRFEGIWRSVSLRRPREGLAWAARQPDYRTLAAIFLAPPQLAAAQALHGNLREAGKVMAEIQAAWADLGQPTVWLVPRRARPGLAAMRPLG